MNDKTRFDTRLVHDDAPIQDHYSAVVPPIYQTSLFTFDSWEAIEQAFEDKISNAIYTRGTNPTVVMAEQKIAELAGGEKAKLFGSGMAAISAGMMHFLKAGDHVITLKNIYGPAVSLLNNFLAVKMNIEVSYVSGVDVEEFAAAIQPNTRLIYLESPSSAMFSLQDIRQISALAKQHSIATMLDNTWATPIYQKPLEMGIDLEMHSCSKYLGGHSDIVCGVLIGSQPLMDAIHKQEFELMGALMAPMEAWMLLRSLRTLPIRLERHSQSAMKVAQFLESHDQIDIVNYPGLPSFAQFELAQQQMSGNSGLLSFRLKSNVLEQVKTFFNGLKLFQIGVSWGGHESLIFAPAISYSKEHTPEQFTKMGLSLGDMRISVGLENADDLIADLAQALGLIEV